MKVFFFNPHSNNIPSKQSQSSEYKNERAGYVRQKVDEDANKSGISSFANDTLMVGLFLLAGEKLCKNPRKLPNIEKVGYGITLVGIALWIVSMFQNAFFSIKHMKE